MTAHDHIALSPTYVDLFYSFFIVNPPAHSYIYPLSLHDALPILIFFRGRSSSSIGIARLRDMRSGAHITDRKSTRLNSSHVAISYAVFCLKKKRILLVTRKLFRCSRV